MCMCMCMLYKCLVSSLHNMYYLVCTKLTYLNSLHWYGLLRKVPSPLHGTSQSTRSNTSSLRGRSSARPQQKIRLGLPSRANRWISVFILLGSMSFASTMPENTPLPSPDDAAIVVEVEVEVEVVVEWVRSASACMRESSCSVLLPGAAHISMTYPTYEIEIK